MRWKSGVQVSEIRKKKKDQIIFQFLLPFDSLCFSFIL